MTREARIAITLLATVWPTGTSSLLRAQDASHKLTAMDEFQIQLPTDPQISPDGKKIVYVRRFADAVTDKRYSNLWIINTDGSDHRPLTTGNRSDTSPRWFQAKVRTLPICPARLQAQSGPILRPRMTGWSIASTARAISSRATCRCSSSTRMAARRGK